MENTISDEFRFLVLNNTAAWDEGLKHFVQVTEQGISIRETQQYALEQTVSAADFLPALDIRDFAVDPCGQLYILDAKTNTVHVFDPLQKRLERAECTGAMLKQPSRIAFTPGTLYIADAGGEPVLYSFAQVNRQIKWAIRSHEDSGGRNLALTGPLLPADLALDSKGNVYVLDARNGAVIVFNSGGIYIDRFGSDELQGKEPSAIVMSADGILHVLERRDRKVLKYADGKFLSDFSVSELTHPSGIAVDADGSIYVGQGQPVANPSEDRRYIFKYSSSGHHIGNVSGYRGAANKIVVQMNRMYIFNEEEQKIVILRLERTLLRATNSPLARGVYISRSFDCKEEETKWHKLVLDAQIPENTQIKLSYLISDTKKFTIDVNESHMEMDLDLYLADDTVSVKKKVKVLDGLPWSAPITNPKDALVRGAKGRYLWVRAELIGSDKISPVIHSVRAVFPRMSYLRYLPAVYQEDEGSRDFLERYLSLFETFFTDLEQQVKYIARWFDADTVGGEFLRWLASWLSVAANNHWTEEQLRLILKSTPELYKKRGTREGIERLIEIVTGQKPIIVEQFQLQCIVDSDVRQVYAQLYGDDPYSFCILLKPEQVKEEHALSALKRLLDLEKPAHTRAAVRVMEPWIYLGTHTYLGMNSFLTKPSSRLDHDTVIQRDTVLTDTAVFGQMNVRSGLGTDTILT